MKKLIILVMLTGCFSADVHDAAVKHDANLKVFVDHSVVKPGPCSVCKDEDGKPITHTQEDWNELSSKLLLSSNEFVKVTAK